MSRRINALNFVFLTIVCLTSGVFSATQTLTKCKVQSKQLMLQKAQRPSRFAETVLSGSTIEYHLKVTSDLNADIRLNTKSQFKLDLYLRDPPTVIKKNFDTWSVPLYKGKEYILAINNCSGKTPGSFQLEITPH